MKNLLLLLLFPVFVLSRAGAQSAAPTKGFTVTGNVQGLPDGDVKIVNSRGEAIVQSGSKAGAFTLKGSVAEPGLYMLVLGKAQPRYLFLENEAIKISGGASDGKGFSVEESTQQSDPALFNRTYAPILSGLDALGAKIKSTPEDKKPPLVQQYQNLLSQLQTEAGKTISQRRTSYLSLFLLTVTAQINPNIADVEKQFSLLAETLRNSPQGKEIAGYISYAKVGAVGTDALDFTQNDVNDKPVSLSSFKGKYVLVDFWASWCRPCRAENPNVVKVYNKFKDKNFTVLGVSLDQQKEAWLNAISKDRLVWTHVSDLRQWDNAVAQLYRVQSIPQNFLIDPKGKIVAKDLRGEDLEKKLCEYLGCN